MTVVVVRPLAIPLPVLVAHTPEVAVVQGVMLEMLAHPMQVKVAVDKPVILGLLLVLAARRAVVPEVRLG